MKAKFKVNDKVEFSGIPLTITYIHKLPKLGCYPAHYQCICVSQYGNSQAFDERDLTPLASESGT